MLMYNVFMVLIIYTTTSKAIENYTNMSEYTCTLKMAFYIKFDKFLQ